MELRRLNLKQENKVGVLKIDPDSIPNLISKADLADWMHDDPNPYYKIQAIKYPIKANGINYQESFFEEFISKLKDHPIPGDKFGHEMYWGKRATTDFILIGARFDKKSNGKGTVYLKNYIPPVGASGDNSIFIRENKSNMIHYSLVSYTKDEILNDKDGKMIINVVGSIKGERNDAVEVGLGAMEQKTNENKIDNIAVGDKNKSIIEEDKTMTKKELLEALAIFKTNAEITLLEVAEAMGLSNQLVSEKHINALVVLEGFEKLNVENPVEDFQTYVKQIEDNSKAVYDARITTEFGAEKMKNGEDNLLRIYAANQLKDVQSDKLEEAIKNLKENDPISKKLAAEAADFTSDTNVISIVEQKNKKPAKSKSRKVDKV